MSVAPPPSRPVVAQATTIPAGTRLWCIHRASHSATDFTPRTAPITPFGGSRFDSTPEDPYAALYATRSAATVVTESLLRRIPFDEKNHRWLPRVSIQDRACSKLTTTAPLRLIDLSSATALAVIGATEDLTQGEPDQYPHTRHWARLLRRDNLWAHGLLWQSRRNPGFGQDAIVLFSDRCPPNLLNSDGAVRLDTPAGVQLLNTVMRPFRASVSPVNSAQEDPPPPVDVDVFLERTEEDRAVEDASDTDFDSFYLKNYRKVRNILNARTDDWDLAQDATDKAFLIAYRHWATLVEHPNPLGYVVRTGRNALQRSYTRSQKPSHPVLPLDTPGLDPHSADDIAADTINKMVINAAIKELHRDKREVFVLYEVLDHPVADIAHFLGVPQNTVKTRLRAARAALREALGEEFRMGGTR
ncbi:sigma-70 family RNA polymerase sigma factor [Streptomyces mirabilis]|uniref:sigma-70 family RNA polymerase sigma factor n=1 Tax=Streptomyces mirabilis TaxID=68239 RepID=UPI0037F657F4